MKVVFIPGNGNSTTSDNWFPSVKQELEEKGIKVISAVFPDPDLARESILDLTCSRLFSILTGSLHILFNCFQAMPNRKCLD